MRYSGSRAPLNSIKSLLGIALDFTGPGMREIECQHIDPNVLTEFLSL
jgi:hypothetical protein